MSASSILFCGQDADLFDQFDWEPMAKIRRGGSSLRIRHACFNLDQAERQDERRNAWLMRAGQLASLLRGPMC